MKSQDKERLASIAKSLIGKPYKYGAKPEEAPGFFDCSSFTQYVFKQIGVPLPRSAILQAEVGETVTLDKIEAGDLIFLHGNQGFYNKKFPEGIGHVVLYIGDGFTIHAASERIREKPSVIESGAVQEKNLEEVINKLKPLVIIKRAV